MTDKYNGKELFTKDTKGKTRFWKATSNLELNADGHISILIEHGVLGSDKIVKKERFTSYRHYNIQYVLENKSKVCI